MVPISAPAVRSVSTQFDHLQSQTSQTLELLSMLWWDIDYTRIITYIYILYMQSCAYFLYILTFTIIYLCWYFWFDPFSSRKIGMESTNRGSSDPPRRSFVSQAKADKAPTGWSSYRCDHFYDICWSTFQLASLGSFQVYIDTQGAQLRTWKIYPKTTDDQFRHDGKADGQRSCWQFTLWKALSFWILWGCWWSQQHFLAEGEKTNNRSSRRSHETAQRDQMQNCLVIWRLEDSSLPCGRLVWCIFVIPTRSKLQASWAWPSIEQQTCCDDLLWRGWLIGGNLSNSDSGCACGSCRSLFVSSFYLLFVLFVCLLACLFVLLLLSLVGRLVGLFCRCRRRRRRRCCCCCSNLCEHATCPHVLFIVPASQDLPLYYIQLDRQRLKAWIYLRVMSEVAFDWQIPGGFTTCWMNLEDWSIHS